MMEGNQLRLGNHVASYRGFTGIVVGLRQESALIKVTSDGEFKDINFDVWYHHLEGISLTAEILEKCPQFTKSKKYYKVLHPTIGNGLLGYSLSVDSQGSQLGCWDMDDDKVDWFAWRIKYLHQLQNLYFVLTENELEIAV